MYRLDYSRNTYNCIVNVHCLHCKSLKPHWIFCYLLKIFGSRLSYLELWQELIDGYLYIGGKNCDIAKRKARTQITNGQSDSYNKNYKKKFEHWSLNCRFSKAMISLLWRLFRNTPAHLNMPPQITVLRYPYIVMYLWNIWTSELTYNFCHRSSAPLARGRDLSCVFMLSLMRLLRLTTWCHTTIRILTSLAPKSSFYYEITRTSKVFRLLKYFDAT
jgi:hypothetical protein